MTIRTFEDARGETTIETDVVIVGSGPGGAASAKVLAEAGARVLILEEGPGRPRFRPNQANTARYHLQEEGMMVARGSAMMPIAAGRGVGGGTLVNSAICFRTPDHVLDSWTPVLGGDDRFSPAHMAPVFDEIEGLIGVGLTSDAVAGENNRVIVRGAAKLGLPGGLLRRNAPGCVGCGVCNFGCPSGGKGSVDRNLIPAARDHGAIVQADVKVDTVLVEGDRVAGVAGNVQDTDTRDIVGRLVARAPIVILAAGAIGTPRLLWHSGVAERLGPRVGKGLHVHPGSAVLGWCDAEIRMWRGATQGAYFEDPALPGVLPHTLSGPPEAMLLATGKVGIEAKEAMARLNHLCGCLVMVSDHGEGWVRSTSAGRADMRYWFDPKDVETIKKGVVRAAEVIMAGGATEIFAPIRGIGTHKDVDSFAAALKGAKISDFTLYAAHPMATCRMGADPETSVVGPDGQAHGLKGLYLADSSVFPTSLGVNPQLTTMTLATVIARHLAASA